jgi:NADP-dependent 3-hydroxy acid dehydrogenase YdfG
VTSPSSSLGSGVIFGASSGIGAALARQLFGRCELVLASRRGTGPIGERVRSVRCDVRDYASVAELLSAAGSPDFVVSCVGVGHYAPLTADHAATWGDIVQTNIVGVANVLSAVRRFTPRCRQVMVVGSLAAKRRSPTPGNEVYRASKVAVSALLEDFRHELRAKGNSMKVCHVVPGFVEGTDFGRRFFETAPSAAVNLFGQSQGLSAEQVAHSMCWVLDAEVGIEISEILVRPTLQST